MIGIGDRHPEVPHAHAPLVDVLLIDHVNARRRREPRPGRIGDPQVPIRPAGERLLELGEHLLGVEIARDRDREIGGEVVPVVERDQILARDSFDRSAGGLRRREVLLAAHEPLELALLDRRRVVVAPLHLLQRLALGELEAVFGETRIAQHIGEQIEPRVDVLRQAVERSLPLYIADPGVDRGRQERDLLVEHIGRFGLGAARAHLRPGHLREAGLAGRLEIIARPNQHRDVDQRELMILHQKRRRPVRELVLIIGRARRRKFPLPETQLPRMLHDRVRRECPERHRAKNEKTSHLPPPAAAARFEFSTSTFRPSAVKYFLAIRCISSAVTV